MCTSRVDYISENYICLADNTYIEDAKKKFQDFKYAVVMRNGYKNGTNGMTRWLHKTLEKAREECIACGMADNPCYVYDLWNNVEVK